MSQVRRRVEVAVLVLAALLAVVMFLLQWGPPPLMLLPWLVVAVIGTHLATAGRAGPPPQG